MNQIFNQQNVMIEKTRTMPFWKVGFFEIMCVERLWKVYEKACIGKTWDRSAEFQEILELAWNAVLNGSEIDERYLTFCDNSITDDVSDELDTVNNSIVSAIGTLLDEINKKINAHVSHVINRNFEFLDDFLYNYYESELGEADDLLINTHELVVNEIRQQNQVIEKLSMTNSAEEFYTWGRQHCNESILGDFWFL